jgi:hypothetical protein
MLLDNLLIISDDLILGDHPIVRYTLMIADWLMSVIHICKMATRLTDWLILTKSHTIRCIPKSHHWIQLTEKVTLHSEFMNEFAITSHRSSFKNRYNFSYPILTFGDR